MRKKQIFTMIIFFLILAGSVAAGFWIIQKPRNNQVAIVQNGKIIVALDLEQSENGWMKTIPIVCLPNHLVIEYSGTQNGVDTVVQ